MKPYIQIVAVDGTVVGYMYHPDEDDSLCDYLIVGDQPKDFGVQITDVDGQTRSFDFRLDDVGKILARAIAPDTVGFVNATASVEFYDAVSEKELYYGRDNLDEKAIEEFYQRAFHSSTFFFRIRKIGNGTLVLCVVFYDEEIQSTPVDWPDFKW
ncbi:MAG TPA: hypothetical protein P5328_01565 [Candidatus Paceibacterota bacterium]|nr:hypothetical protein [Candidatus Paceibacterota bacterium]HRZ34677.1 hypothetical protein [Candidatus Paceibacterota bacterium]